MVVQGTLSPLKTITSKEKNFQESVKCLLGEGNRTKSIFIIIERHLNTSILTVRQQDWSKMGSLPQGAFAACKLREQYIERDLQLARLKAGNEKTDVKNLSENKEPLEYSPVKYNGKLMNSIWGLYNRYSPHNIKGNEYVSAQQIPNSQQQNVAVVPNAVATKLATATSGGRYYLPFSGK